MTAIEIAAIGCLILTLGMMIYLIIQVVALTAEYLGEKNELEDKEIAEIVEKMMERHSNMLNRLKEK